MNVRKKMYELSGGKINSQRITSLSKCLRELEWDNLTPEYQQLITEICGEKGTGKIHNLIEAIHDNHPEMVRKINDIICDPKKDYDYSDNERIARTDNPLEMAVYEYQFKNGCCGYYDKTVTLNGVEYKIGFNYGH